MRTLHNYYYEEYRQNQALHRDINRAANDEHQAIQYYSALANMAPNNEIKQIILGIRQDEIRHLHAFSRSYNRLAGGYPNLTSAVLPKNFREGVIEALKDEGKTPAFYRSIAARTTDVATKRRFLQAAEDEARHEQLFRQIARQTGIRK
ncbi:ferritin-like domain-containing protein [Bacillus sp. REN10]|uniref:ferritin-like domain-containing protein n=1 Tax=Bacillus sp. REN10 TaxID=2782541 RepID=UPI001EEF298F|nr:ferritin-like domain-containing protein [Bacillus sp. REN10]